VREVASAIGCCWFTPNSLALQELACSTIHAVLDRHGLGTRAIHSRTRTQGTRLSSGLNPNDLWSTDYKGELMLGNRRYCYPLVLSLFLRVPENAAVLHVQPLLVQIRKTIVADIGVVTTVGGRKHSRLQLTLDVGDCQDVQ
jgi:hypothetical protein